MTEYETGEAEIEFSTDVTRNGSKVVATRPEWRPAPPVDVDGWVAAASDIVKLANLIAPTDFVPAGLRDNAAAIAACVLTGRELGLQPMMALRHVQVIRGTPTLSAEYKRARILAAGHEFQIPEWTNTRCTVRGRRRGQSQWTQTTYTIDDAKRAKLVRAEGTWVTRPRRMLLARASSDLADAIFSDVVQGLPTTELVESGDDFEGYAEPGVKTEEREQPKQTRKRNTPAKANPEPVPELAPEPPAAVQADELGEVEPDAGPEVADPDPSLEPISREMHDVIMARFREMGYDKDSDHAARARALSALAQRAVEHVDDLTMSEASAVADVLAEVLHGRTPQKAARALGVIIRQNQQPVPPAGEDPGPGEPLPDGEPE